MKDFRSKNFYRVLSLVLVALLTMTMLPAKIKAESPPKAKVILTFDDGWYDTHAYALPILRDAGFPATIYVVRDIALGDGADTMRTAQIQELYDAGWDISNHTINHKAYDDGVTDIKIVTNDLEELEGIYLDNQNWIINNFGPRGAFHVAYPSGLYSEELINEVLIKIGAKTGRLAEKEDLVTAPLHDTLDYYTLPVIPLESENSGVDQAKAKVDQAISTGSTIIFMLHRVLPDLEDLVFTTGDLETFVDYLTLKQDQVDVMTMSEWYDNYAASSATPGPPAGVSMDDTANTVSGLHSGLEYNLDGTGYTTYNAATFSEYDLSGYHFLLVRQKAAGSTPAGLPATFIFTPGLGEAKLIFAFHHANKGIRDYALPVLSQNGLRATSYVSRDIVLWPEEERREQILDSSDLAALYAAGWDIGNRTYNGSEVADQTSADLANLFGQTQTWLAENSWTRGLAEASYSGSYGNQLFDAFSQIDIENGIFVSDANQGTFKAPRNNDQNRYHLSSTTIYNDDPYYISKAKAAIDEAIHQGRTVILSIYDVQPGVSGPGIILSQAGLGQIAAYAKTKINQGLLLNTTVSELIEQAGNRAILYARNGGIGEMLATIAPAGSQLQLRPLAFDRPGYTFSGWNSQADGSGSNYADQAALSMPEAGLTLYAQWTEIPSYTVSFDTNGGSSLAAALVPHDSLLPLPDQPEKPGYDFMGWYKDPGYSSSWDFSSDLVTADLTLYAKWQIRTYTVSFLDWDEQVLQTGQYEHGTSAPAPADPVRAGYEFKGWDKDFSQITADLTVLATYSQIAAVEEFTVSFNSNGGSQVSDIALTSGSLVPEPANPEKAGHDFAGWFQDEELSLAWDFSETPVTADLVLYAAWTLQKFTVVFYDHDGAILKQDQVDYGQAATAPPDPHRDGYDFIGWDTDFSFISAATIINARYEAQPLPEIFTVTYESNGGNQIAPVTAPAGSLLEEPVQPEKEGYNFAGWQQDEELTSPWDFSQDQVSTNLTLYAKWNIKQFTVVFSDWDNVVLHVETVDYKMSATAPADPQRAGYNFLGWDNAYDNITEDTHLTALYQEKDPEVYPVSFVSNGGNLVADQLVQEQNLLPQPPAPQKAGHTFAGWYKDETLSTAWDFALDLVTSPLILYAAWTVNNYTVSFVDQDGTSYSQISAAYDSYISRPPDPQKTGHTFSGWYKDTSWTEAWDFANARLSGDLVLYASWDVINYTVSYLGFGQQPYLQSNAPFQTKLSRPADPTADGHTFTGWYKDEQLSQSWDFTNDLVSGDLTLYSNWSVNSYTVSFVDHTGAGLAESQVSYGQLVAKPLDPQRTGHTFTGWYKDKQLWDFATDTVTNHITLQASWQINVYTVSFHDWDASVLKSEQVAYGNPATAPAAPQRAGYNFTGWNKDFSLITANTLVTAVYTEKPPVYYNVSFNSNGGSSVADASVVAGQRVVRPADPSRSGYNFNGWYKDKNLTSSWQFATDLVTGNLTLYAGWTARTYQVTFKDWDGRTIKTEQVTHGKSATAPASPTRPGYAFKGWDKSLANITQSTTFNAVYKKSTITSQQVRISQATALLGPVSAGTSARQLKDRLDNESSTLVISSRQGQPVAAQDTALASGMKILIENEAASQLDIIVLGDINGDSQISVLDMLMLKKHLLGQISLDKTGYQAALLAEGDKPSVLGLLRLKKHLLGQLAISVN